MFCCDALDALFIFYYFIDWRWAARRSMRCTCKSLRLFFFPVSRVATLTGEPFRLYFSFSFRLTYVHLLLLVGIIRRFFFPPFLLLFVLRRVYVLLLFLSCLTVLRKERSFFFPLVCRFAAFMVLHHCLGLDTYTRLEHQQQQQKGSFKLESKNWERAKQKKTLCWRLWLRRDADSTSLSTAHRRRWRTSLDLRVSAYRRMHQFLFFYGWLVRNLVRGKEKKKWVVTYELYTSEVTLLCFPFNTILLLVQCTVFFLTFLVFFFFRDTNQQRYTICTSV